MCERPQLEALHAGAAAHHGQMSAAIAVLALASGSGSFDAAGNLMVTAEHAQAQFAQCFHFRWPVGWSSSTFRFGALSAAPCHLLGRGQLIATVIQNALPSQCTVLVPLPRLLLPSHVQPFTQTRRACPSQRQRLKSPTINLYLSLWRKRSLKMSVQKMFRRRL